MWPHDNQNLHTIFVGFLENKDCCDVLLCGDQSGGFHVDTVAGSRWVGIEYKMMPGHDNNAVKF